jgi:squalene-hopene/tetraprenyl-beta-curcumene cyclase
VTDEQAAIERTIRTLTRRLLESRTPDGHWEGYLASSALATATSTLALSLAREESLDVDPALVASGAGWLTAHQNGDGGWGDTVQSRSNLSTTALCWASLSGTRDTGGGAGRALGRARQWLEREVGTLAPDRLKAAIVRRYGQDRTFSVPILTALALRGKLGEGQAAWRRVPQLPFELAALPHVTFRWLRLPVVSYALPALIAIGQVRHHHAPTRNPLLGALRGALRSRTLASALRMQPASGGYLEAVPLTAFVAMSLTGAGSVRHPVVANGLRFLASSLRPDGSWAIDTNLATWVTTGALRALAASGSPPEDVRGGRIRTWLLEQQLREKHPFTHARAGGWAWTDSSGGVPDSDDTAGALCALRLLGDDLDAADRGIRWLLELQNRDGGIPTFCRGWGALPFDRSAPDLTAHALEAWGAWYPDVGPALERRIVGAALRAVRYLENSQNADGSWEPLWFGNQNVPGERNPTYGTSRVVTALAALPHAFGPTATIRARGRTWLVGAQRGDGGWGGAENVPASIEETGAALEALASTAGARSEREAAAIRAGARWLVETTREGNDTPASPIGLYFARLWYHEELYPLIFALRGLSKV